MAFLNNLIDSLLGDSVRQPRSNAAQTLMLSLNPNALCYHDGDRDIFIEDVLGSEDDGGLYRLEYQTTPNGDQAVAFVRSNPWDRKRPGAGLDYRDAHVNPKTGSICVGKDHYEDMHDSCYDLNYVVLRARFWCTVFSAWQEGGRRQTFNDIAMGR